MRKIIVLLVFLTARQAESQKIEVRGTEEQIKNAKMYLEKNPNVKKIEIKDSYIRIWTNNQQPLPNSLIDEAFLSTGVRLLD